MSNDNPQPPPPNHRDPSSTTTTSPSPTSAQPNTKSNSQPPTSTSTRNNEDPSLLTRIQSSATNLLRDAITNPNAHALGSDLGQLRSAAVNDKAATTSSSSSLWQQGGVSGEFVRSGPSSAAAAVRDGAGVGDANANIPLGEGLRSAQNQNAANNIHGLESFDQEQFQTSYGEINIDIDTDDVRKGKGKEKGKSPISSSDLYSQFNKTDDNNIPGQYDTAWHHATTHNNVNIQENYNINSRDGAEVVSLLSVPSFQPEFADDNDFSLRDEDTPAPLTADEIRILDSFRRQSHHQQQQPPSFTLITPHSLIPDIDTFLAENDSSIQNNNTAALRDAVLHNLPGAEDWMAVNDRYQDEVWGYLRPALEAASREIEENKKTDGSKPEREGPAVRRLKMILRHMQS